MTPERNRRDDRPVGRIDAIFEGIDGPNAVRGASTGLSVLVIGGLAQPIAASLAPAIGGLWLAIVAVVAFAIAAWRIGSAPIPAVHGAAAAVCAYLLVLPLVLFTATGRDPLQIAATAAVALVTGAATGYLRGRARG